MDAAWRKSKIKMCIRDRYVSIEELNSMYEMIEELPDYIVECLDEFISHYGAYSDEEVVALTRELTEVLHRNRTIDWNRKESALYLIHILFRVLCFATPQNAPFLPFSGASLMTGACHHL